MNYYEHHLGDYAKDTGHLSMLEHGAYRTLLDRYYSTEAGIPAAQVHRLARARTDEEREAVDAVLAEFFEQVDGAWINRRAEEEIAKANNRISAARSNGTKGGRPKNQNETQKKPSGFSVGSENETQQKALHTPDTTTHTPEENPTPTPSHGKGEKFDPLAMPLPACVPASAWSEWVNYRRGRRLTCSEATMVKQLRFLTEASTRGNPPQGLIDTAIRSGWQGLFEPVTPPARGNPEPVRQARQVYQ